MYPSSSVPSRDGGVSALMDSGVLLRTDRGNLTSLMSAGLEPYSSQDMKPASLGDPEKEALQLEGRGTLLSGQDDRLTRLGAPRGGEWDSGIDIDLLCWREEDSNVREGRVVMV